MLIIMAKTKETKKVKFAEKEEKKSERDSKLEGDGEIKYS